MFDGRYIPGRGALLVIVALTAFLCMGASQPGCGGANKLSDGTAGADGTVHQRLMDAQAALAKHDVAGAQRIYDQLVAQEPNAPGDAYAGKALTDLMMLPGSSSMTTIFVERLGATSGIDANDAVWADEGYLYWLARGVPWTDEGAYSGIKSLIADELPWSSGRMASVRDFFGGLDSSTNATMDDLVAVADAMAQIQYDVDQALADPDFEWIYIPGRTFHYDDLDLLIGRSELHLLSSVVAATRASIYFAAAYQHDYTLDEVLGAQAQQRQTPHDGWTTADYAIDFVDGELLREVRDPTRLREARTAFNDSLGSAVDAIDAGLAYHGETTLRWHDGDERYAAELADFLEALRNALYGRTELPGTTPKTTLDLSPLFVQGRTLPADVRWFERVDADMSAASTDPNAAAHWRMTDAARQAFFVDGLFDPGFDVTDGGPDVAIGAERADKFRQSVSGPIEGDIENAYFTTQ